MFRFYEPVDVALLAAGALFSALGGALFPAVNVAFGNMLDSTAVGDVGSKINNAVIAMEIVAVSLGVELDARVLVHVVGGGARGEEYAKRVRASDVGAGYQLF